MRIDTVIMITAKKLKLCGIVCSQNVYQCLPQIYREVLQLFTNTFGVYHTAWGEQIESMSESKNLRELDPEILTPGVTATCGMCRCWWLLAALVYMLEIWKETVMEEYLVYCIYIASNKQGV
jgi:hypothetical protein